MSYMKDTILEGELEQQMKDHELDEEYEESKSEYNAIAEQHKLLSNFITKELI